MKLFLFFILTLFSCNMPHPTNTNIIGYNLNQPDAKYELPDELKEISGLTHIDSVTFACVQDENGTLYIYDMARNIIQNRYTFHYDGDYEGIARVGKTIYILRSDGDLFEISDYTADNFVVSTYTTNIPANNNEGLCYDAANHRLLIACKGKLGKGSELKDKRAIYGFDLSTKTLSANPVFEFDVNDIKQYAIANNVAVQTKTKKKKKVEVVEPVIKFMSSAVGIHPITKKLFLLSASDHLFFIVGDDGRIEHMELLNPYIFNKAEGLTFFDNGDMLITNEGQKGKPTLLRFNYQK